MLMHGLNFSESSKASKEWARHIAKRRGQDLVKIYDHQEDKYRNETVDIVWSVRGLAKGF